MKAIIAVLLLLLALAAESAHAVDRAAVERQFQTWLRKELRPKALAAGIKPDLFDRALGSVSLDWDLPDLVPPGAPQVVPQEQRQAEFRAPGAYLSERNLAGVVGPGREHLRRHGALLERIERRTGVPGRIIVAIWGRESGFGRAAIGRSAFSVLATKAFMATRRQMFEEELLAALQLAQQTGIAPSAMKSSWAGALGQPQFMPSSYLRHAIDGDGDGKADIWNSQADTLASIANYLARNDWVAGRDWGFEVEVPGDFPCYLEGPDQGRKIVEWERMGVRRINGKPFPPHEARAEGYLLMPAGRFGPAFIVTPNFYVLKAYNESDVYALFIGHAGDRMQFASPAFATPWQPIPAMRRSDIAKLQEYLVARGHDVGGADGLAGFRTRRSIGLWQERNGSRPTCFPMPGMPGIAAIAK